MKFIQLVVPAAIIAVASSAMAATPNADSSRKDRMDAAYQNYRASATKTRFIASVRKAPAKAAPMKAKAASKSASKARAKNAK